MKSTTKTDTVPVDSVPKERIRLADWSGFTDFGGDADVYAPRTEAEVIDLVRYCRDNGKKLRVVGLQTSWNSLWYSAEAMMTTRRLNRILEIDTEKRTITCEAGATLEQIHKALWDKGLSLDTAPAVDWVTIGGSVSTGSHGSGPASNSSSLIACRLVTADGEVIEIGPDDYRLDAVRLAIGMLGVMTTVTLKVVDAFYVSMRRTRVRTEEWQRYLSEGDMSYLLWFPETDYSVLARVDILANREEARRLAADASPEGFDANNSDDLDRLGVDVGSVVSAIAGFANTMPSTFAARNRFLLDVLFQDIVKVGPAHEVLMSFESAPIAGGEWSVPASCFAAALADLQAEIASGDFHLPIVWLKKVASESAWLSAADEQCVQCGIYHHLIDGTPSHVKEMVMRVERLMLKHGGRPHLGKLIYLDPADLKRMYPNWEKFNALRRQMDPTGMFWSGALAASFGD